ALSLEQPSDQFNASQQQPTAVKPAPLTSEALAAQTSPSVAIAAAEHVPDAHAQQAALAQEAQPSPSPHPPAASANKPRNRPHVLTEIPSAYDLYDGSSHSSGTRSIASSSSDASPPSTRSSVNEGKSRFEKLPHGGHRHNLCAPKRHQFLATQARRLRGLLDSKKDKEKEGHGHGHFLGREMFEHPLSLLNGKIDDFQADHHNASSGGSKKKHSLKEDFMQKYGDLQQVVGRGAFGTVRLSIKKNAETGGEVVFAIKEFKHNHDESQKSYMRRLTSEFCIASSLRHINVIQTLDLLQLHGDSYSEVMEYCSGGDLHTLIASAGTLSETESGCFFAQLINGVAFLHSMGVVHRDLKPENLLLTADGCVKIADFGNSEVFRMPWEKKVRASESIRGSGPFIAPEEFITKTFDARKVDTWSCGIIYMCMRLGRYNWAEASKGDHNWDGVMYKVELWREMKIAIPGEQWVSEHAHPPKYINLAAIEAAMHMTLAWPDHISEVIDRLLEPDPANRWHAGHVLESEWMQDVDNCHPAERPIDQALNECDFDPAPSQRVGSKVLQHDSDVTGSKFANELKIRRGEMVEAVPAAAGEVPVPIAVAPAEGPNIVS
ncbi:serine/threonine-protein kinase HAL4/sat4, partial [Dissophora ornata]